MRHPLIWGVAWSAVFTGLLLAAIFANWPVYTSSIILTLLCAPSLVATVIVLSGTPRQHFDAMSSVFGHFFIRYLALVIGLIAWSGSVVLGAAISSFIQTIAQGDETAVVGVGFDLLSGIIVIVVSLLWAAFVLRCSWFLVRVRGWRETPRTDRVPGSMLERHPRLRRLAIGLAHPALFTATGLISAVFAPYALLLLDLPGE